jgi:hypothetical protein
MIIFFTIFLPTHQGIASANLHPKNAIMNQDYFKKIQWSLWFHGTQLEKEDNDYFLYQIMNEVVYHQFSKSKSKIGNTCMLPNPLYKNFHSPFIQKFKSQ